MSGELFEEPHVVLEQEADVADLVPCGGQAVQADAEGKAGIDLRIDAAAGEDVGMDHARAEDFDPAGAFADPAALAAAGRAGNVHFHAGLGEGEEGGAEPDLGFRPVYLMGEFLENPFQVAQGDALVHDEALHLMEDGGMGGVHLVGPVDPSGTDHPDGGTALFHDPDLGRGGLAAQQQVLREVEGILHIPGGMVFRKVERLEAVVLRLHLRAVHHVEAHGLEDPHQLFEDQVEGMEAAGGHLFARQGDVDGFVLQAFFLQGGADSGGPLLHRRLQSGAQLVDQLAHGGPFLRRQGAHAPQQAGELAFFAHIAHAEVLQLFRGVELPELMQGLFPQGL